MRTLNKRNKQATYEPAPALTDTFRLRCEARPDLVAACLMDFHEAIDGLQAAAVRYGLVKDIGQDAVQVIMAEAFRRAR